MKFREFAVLCEQLEKTSKRLEKILLLRDFFKQNPSQGPLVFDLITGNYQRKINKKTLGISLRTLLSVLSFVGKKSENSLNKKFNSLGDVGKVALESISTKQKSLFSKELELEHIFETYSTISSKTGKNSNKVKKEILSELFLRAKEDIEYKFLARLLVDDLRIGVSDGVLKEAYVNWFFPAIENVQIECSKCSYINLNLETCFNCSEKLISKKHEKLSTYSKEKIQNSKNIPSKESFISSNEPRELYNYFLYLIEKKYNLVNSFEILHADLKKERDNVFVANIKLGIPLRSMLGSRVDTISQGFETTGKPSLVDYKYDGLRVQIHNDKGDVTLFSRNLDNITKQFPEIVEFIKKNYSDVSFVADSECVGYDFQKEKFLPFQVLSRRIMTKKVDTVSHITIVVKLFDLLYLNSKTLTELKYEKRREKLENLLINRKLTQKLHFDPKSI